MSVSFVLVPGAWHGGWAWQRVARLLRGAGHDVHTPTLTGVSDRAHLLSPSVGLSTHVTDVVSLIEAYGLSDVVLVGHSYGGQVITGVADKIADRIAKRVYLDAFAGDDGEDNAAHAPWAWDDWNDDYASDAVATDPAALVAGYFSGTGTFSLDYTRNPYRGALR